MAMSRSALDQEGVNILVVEDERIVALDLCNKLSKQGYNVLGAVPSGEKALEMLANTHPDLILMDIMLEGELDGIETVQRIRERSDVPVAYVTAYTDEATRKRADKTSPQGFLPKPVDMVSLKDAIERILYKNP